MFPSRSIAASSILPGLLVVLGLMNCGCERSEKITTYSVPKHDSLQTKQYLDQYAREHPKPVPRQMIGVVIPKPDLWWFLKLSGDVDAVADREQDVRRFLKSIRFSAEGTPEWIVPNGWRRLPPSEGRYATLLSSGNPPLELSVTALPPPKDVRDGLLENVNRWRKQLMLPQIEMDQLDPIMEQIPANGLTAYWVKMSGFSRLAPMAPPEPSAGRAKKAENKTPGFEKPAEWQQGPATAFSKASFEVSDGTAKVSITLSTASGSLLANVNRWRNQLDLPPLNSAELSSAAQTVNVGGLTGNIYAMSNDDRTILGVIVEDQDQSTWFVKLIGDSALAERERPRFEAFLKSLHF